MKDSIRFGVLLFLTILLWLGQVCYTTDEANVVEEDICGCGEAQAHLAGRIVGGNGVNISHHPWLVMIIKNHELLCAGALLNDRYVVTAAHCFPKRTKLTDLHLWLGVSTSPPEEAPSSLTAQVDEIIIHPHYQQRTLANDICLIRLSTPVRFSSVIRPVCLPPPDAVFDDTTAVLAGWGNTREDGYQATELQEVTLPVVDLNECYRVLRHPLLRRSNLCAGFLFGGKDACQGDSGSPLVWTENNTWHVIGLVSWGEGCGRERAYGVYTRISDYVGWLIRAMDEAQTCTRPGVEPGTSTDISNSTNMTSTESNSLKDKVEDSVFNTVDKHDLNKDEQKETTKGSWWITTTPIALTLEQKDILNRDCDASEVLSCGTSLRQGRIMGGSTISPQKYPWTVALLDLCGANCLRLICGAIMIGCNWALTAASCLSGRKLSTIRAAVGVENLGTLLTNSDALIPILKVILPPDQTKHNIALLQIASNFSQPICLPTNAMKKELLDGQTLTAVGWGRTGFSYPSSNWTYWQGESIPETTDVYHDVYYSDDPVSLQLREAQLPVISNRDCAKVFPAAVHSAVLCAGGRVNESACFGDFGGPLLKSDPMTGQFYIVGVMSFVASDGCGFRDVPAGYVRVGNYVNWIRNAVQSSYKEQPSSL